MRLRMPVSMNRTITYYLILIPMKHSIPTSSVKVFIEGNPKIRYWLCLYLLPGSFHCPGETPPPMSDFVLFSGIGGTGTTAPPSPGWIIWRIIRYDYRRFCWQPVNCEDNRQCNHQRKYSFERKSDAVQLQYHGGKITAANTAKCQLGTILSVGNSAQITGNIDVKGNIVVGGGTVNGTVTHPAGTTYSGPAPSGGNITGTPTLPTLPAFPTAVTFPAAGAINISSSQTITPGSYGNLTLSGNKTITLNGPGTYVFNKISCSGSSNNFVFNFQNSASGNFLIYVHNDADMGKSSATMTNGGSA